MHETQLKPFATLLLQMLNDMGIQPINRDLLSQRRAQIQRLKEGILTRFHNEQVCSTLNVSPEYVSYVVTGLTEFAVFSFPMFDEDLIARIATFNAYLMLGDDILEEKHDSLATMAEDLTAGRPLQHKFWRGYFSFLSGLYPFYGPHVKTILFQGSIEFAHACWIERKGVPVYKGSPCPLFLRRMTAQSTLVLVPLFTKECEERGAGEILTAQSLLGRFVEAINDVISYYKESGGEGDRMNFVQFQSAVDEVPEFDVVRSQVAVVVEEWRRMHSVLEQMPEWVRTRVSDFCEGHVQFHLWSCRYRMNELAGQVGLEDFARFCVE